MKDQDQNQRDDQNQSDDQQQQELEKKWKRRALYSWLASTVFLFFGFFGEPTLAVIGIFLVYFGVRLYTHPKRLLQYAEEQKAAKVAEEQKKEQRREDEYYDLIDSIKRVKAKASTTTLESLDPDTMPELITITEEDDLTHDDCADFIVINIKATEATEEKDSVTRFAAVKFQDFEPIKYITSRDKALPSLVDFIGDFNVIVGHDLLSDVKFLYESGFDLFKTERAYYDTREISELYFDSDDFDLETMCELYNIYYNSELDALHNCVVIGKLFKELIEELEDE